MVNVNSSCLIDACTIIHLTECYCSITDIDECGIVSNEAEANEFPSYSLLSDSEPGAIPDPLEEPGSVREYPTEYPCLAPAQCVNTEGSFTCQCNEVGSCNQGKTTLNYMLS